jgi:FixJ family two-component response regulator
MRKEAEMQTKLVIAIVDDDESLREATVSLMRASGFAPEAFPSANDFLTSESLQRTDCLVADVQMPGMSGLELHRCLVQSGKAIPTVLITAYPDEKARVRAMEAGVICYLTKPVGKDELLGCIQSALDQGRTRSESQ